MSKGQVFPSETSKSQDAITGAVIYQMTGHPSMSHPTHFLQSSFFPNGTSMIFISYRTGDAQLFQAQFPSGEIRQLTDGEPIHPLSPAIHGLGRDLYFVRGGGIWMIDIVTLRERLVVEFPDTQLSECSLSPNGTWMTAAATQGTQASLVVGRSDGTQWNLIPFPRTVIHPQFHPQDPNWILFGASPAPRMHRVRRDGTAMECVDEPGSGDSILHETFLGRTGDIVFAVWPRELRRMSWKTRAITTIAACNAWHIAPNRSGSQVLCDTNHPDKGLFLIDAATGERRHICMPESSDQGSPTHPMQGPQWIHSQPSFSADGTKAAFCSDRSGTPQVYVAEI